MTICEDKRYRKRRSIDGYGFSTTIYVYPPDDDVYVATPSESIGTDDVLVQS